MEIRSRASQPEDQALSARPGMEGLHVWRLLSGDRVGSRQLIFDVVDVDPGAVHTLHRHPNAEQATYLLGGSGAHLTEDGSFPMSPGDVVFVPAGEWHGFVNDGDTTATILGLWGGVAGTEEAGYENHPDSSG